MQDKFLAKKKLKVNGFLKPTLLAILCSDFIFRWTEFRLIFQKNIKTRNLLFKFLNCNFCAISRNFSHAICNSTRRRQLTSFEIASRWQIQTKTLNTTGVNKLLSVIRARQKRKRKFHTLCQILFYDLSPSYFFCLPTHTHTHTHSQIPLTKWIAMEAFICWFHHHCQDHRADQN